jgi:hypothetical protein
MEVRFVGRKLTGWDLGQRIVGLQLFDDEFDGGSKIVETVDSMRPKAKVGYESMVAEATDGEQRRLGALLLGYSLAHHHKSIRLRPTMWLVHAFRDLEASPDFGILQAWDPIFERTCQPRHDDELPAMRFDRPHHFVVEESRIRADPYLTHRCGQLAEARSEQPDCANPRMHIAGSEFPVPAILGLALEAYQGMIRGTAALARVVADACLLLMSVEGQHGRIQVEQDSPQWLRALTHLRQKIIVKSAELEHAAQTKTSEEPAQRGRIRIGRQTRKCLEDTISTQQLGRLDPAQSQDDGIQQSKKHLGSGVGIVALGETNVLEVPTHTQSLEEAVDQVDATEPREVVACEHDTDVSGATAMAQMPLPSKKWSAAITLILS